MFLMILGCGFFAFFTGKVMFDLLPQFVTSALCMQANIVVCVNLRMCLAFLFFA
jgi:hypothetical protein